MRTMPGAAVVLMLVLPALLACNGVAVCVFLSCPVIVHCWRVEYRGGRIWDSIAGSVSTHLQPALG